MSESSFWSSAGSIGSGRAVDEEEDEEDDDEDEEAADDDEEDEEDDEAADDDEEEEEDEEAADDDDEVCGESGSTFKGAFCFPLSFGEELWEKIGIIELGSDVIGG